MWRGYWRRAAWRAAGRRRARDIRPGREVPARGPGGMQVVIQQPGRGGVPGGRVISDSQGPGVLTEQVMEPVPAGGGLSDQVLIVEGLQASASRIEGGVIEGGGGVGVDVGAGMQAQSAEQPLLAVVQVGIRQAERGRDRQVLGR